MQEKDREQQILLIKELLRYLNYADLAVCVGHDVSTIYRWKSGKSKMGKSEGMMLKNLLEAQHERD